MASEAPGARERSRIGVSSVGFKDERERERLNDDGEARVGWEEFERYDIGYRQPRVGLQGDKYGRRRRETQTVITNISARDRKDIANL